MNRSSGPPGIPPHDGRDAEDDDRREDSDDDHSSQRLADIDDQLGGLAPPSDAVPVDSAGDEALTAEMAKRLDIMLLLRMVAGGRDTAKPAVFGKFRVLEQIGEGGFAKVYEVIDTKLARREALKIARPEILLDRRKTRRFLREARLAARVAHPNVVVIHEVGEHDRLPYIAEELCGESLSQWLDRHPGPMPPRVAAEVVRLLAEATHVAHGAGVLHRDIKPGNVLLVPAAGGPLPPDDRPGADRAAERQTVKLGDFGLSVLLFDADEPSSGNAPTELVTTCGTPEWMAPETVLGGPADERTDIHALGLVLDRLLTGRCLNAGPTRGEVFRRIRDVEPEPADRVVNGIPADLVAVCLKCLAKNPAERYRSAAELAVDLARFLEGLPTIARPLTPVGRLARWARRNPARAGAVAACLAALCLGGIAWRERSIRIRLAKKQAVAERAAARGRAVADAAHHLRRGFETLRSGNVKGALEALETSTAADPGLADSIAGGWLLARVHGERETLLGPAEPGPRGTAAGIHRIAVAPDGRRLAAAGADGVLRIRPLAADGGAAGEAIVVEAGTELNDVAFSPDGALLATAAENGCVRLWDARDGRLVREVAEAGEPVFAVAFLEEGRRLVWAGVDRTIRIVSLEMTGSPAAPVRIRPFDPPAAEGEPEPADIEAIRVVDDRRLLVAIDHDVWLVAIPSGELLRRFVGEKWGDVMGVDVSPDGTRLLATGWFDRVGKVWDLASGELLLTLPPHPAWVQRGVFTSDGERIVTACKDGVLRVFDAASGTLLESLVGHVDRAWDGLVHPSGAILSSGSDGTVRVWDDRRTSDVGRSVEIPLSGVVAAVPLPTPGSFWIHPSSGLPATFEPASGATRTHENARGNGVWRIVPDAAGERIVVSDERGLRVVDTAGGGSVVLVARQTPGAIQWGPAGDLFAAIEEPGRDGADSPVNRLVAWGDGLSRRSDIAELPANTSSLAVTTRPRPRLAAASGTRIIVFDLGPDGLPVAASMRTIADLAPKVSPGILLAWSPDGARLAWGSTGGLVGILDADSGAQGAMVTSFIRAVRGIVWAHNSRALLVADEECIRLHDVATGTMLDEIRPGWTITSMTMAEGLPGALGPTLVVTGDARQDGSDQKPTGRLLLVDLGRRLPRSVAR